MVVPKNARKIIVTSDPEAKIKMIKIHRIKKSHPNIKNTDQEVRVEVVVEVEKKSDEHLVRRQKPANLQVQLHQQSKVIIYQQHYRLYKQN